MDINDGSDTLVRPYGDIKIKLVGMDGNAFSIMGRVRSAMQKADVPKDEIKVILDDMMSGDYDHLLQVAMREFDVR